MKKCRYCRRNPCGCGAEYYYPEMMEECGAPIIDADISRWVGTSGTHHWIGDSGSSYYGYEYHDNDFLRAELIARANQKVYPAPPTPEILVPERPRRWYSWIFPRR